MYEDAARRFPSSARRQDDCGFVLAALQRYPEAIASFRRALELDAKFALAHYHLGVVYWLTNQHDSGLTELRAAAGLEPKNYDFNYRLGSALNERGEFKEAVGRLQRAVGVRAGSADAWGNLGLALQRSG